MYAKCDFKCTLVCANKEKRHEVKALQLQILFSKVFEGKTSSAFKGGHCSVVHPAQWCSLRDTQVYAVCPLGKVKDLRIPT